MRYAIIPARGGSTRIPRKNIKDFFGKPIIAYSIDAAMRSQAFDEIFVSSDDDEILDVARMYGAKTHKRQPAHAADHVGTHKVMQVVLKEIGEKKSVYRPRTEFAACIYPCAPLIDPEDLYEAAHISTMTAHDFSMPCGEWLKDPGQFYTGTIKAWFRHQSMMNANVYIHQIPEWRAIDVNTPEDWARLEAAYRKHVLREGE